MRAGVLPCAPGPLVGGRRVLKPRAWRLGAWSAGERVAAALRDRGLGAGVKAVRTAGGRAGTIARSAVWPSPRWLTPGRPPSCATIRSKPAGVTSGRCSLAAPWVLVRACAARAGTSAPRRPTRVVSR